MLWEEGDILVQRRTGWWGLIEQQQCNWMYVIFSSVGSSPALGCQRMRAPLLLSLPPTPARFSRTAVARVSDDYYPRDPASSTPHIGACAFNSLYLGALVQPDWDMFQSAHPAGE